MRIVDPGERLHGAGLCFLCEEYINIAEAGNLAIDTARDFDPPFQTPLAGQKYICGSCARGLAHIIGWVKPEEADALRERAITAEEKNAAILHNIETLKLNTATDAVSPFNSWPPSPAFGN